MISLVHSQFDCSAVTPPGSAGKDATAAAQAPGLDGYKAALTNFRFIANSVLTTKQVVADIAKAGR